MPRKEMKTRAKKTVKSHYGILFAACLFAAVLGAEFTESLDFLTLPAYFSESTAPGMTAGTTKSSLYSAVADALSGNIEEGEELSSQYTEEEVQKTKSGKGVAALGRSRGIFARSLNGISSGSLFVSLIAGASSLGASTNAILAIFITAAVLLFASFWFFFTNLYPVMKNRIFLESRIYEKTPMQRFLFLYRVKKWGHAAFVLFMTSLFKALWFLTVIGGIIKHYAYFLVPYVVAENPALSLKEALALSEGMMRGHKWQCFCYELSFLPWKLLNLITLGLSGLFFSNPYQSAFFAEYYVTLREKAKENALPLSHLLNDTCLYAKASPETLKEAYADILDLPETPPATEALTGFRGFLVKTFGISLYSKKESAAFEKNDAWKTAKAVSAAAVGGRTYPTRLSAIPESRKRADVKYVRYLRPYTVSSLILLFFIFSFIGWMWEVSLHLLADGHFVNRGVLHGPWLPIYGTGGLLILILLHKFRAHPLKEFIAAVLLCGCVEYFSSCFLELTHNGKKWWDYSGYFLNLNGRICAEGLLVFGVGGMVIVYFAAPLMDNALRKLSSAAAACLCALLLISLTADNLYSFQHPNTGKGITDYKGASLSPAAPKAA